MVLTLAAPIALANQQNNAKSGGGTQKPAGQQYSSKTFISPSSHASFVDENACAPSQYSHQEELCIEWQAAKAAESQAFWAAATFGVGFVGTVFVLLNLYYARRATEAAQASAAAAESAVEQSNLTLAHAQEVATRDLRPWLTLRARLTECVDFDRFDYDERPQRFEIFVEIRCVNVGKVAAENVVYAVSGGDLLIGDSDEKILQKAITKAEDRSYLARVRGQGSFNVLAPSEEHVDRYYCIIPGPEPDTERDTISQDYSKLRIAIAVAYSTAGNDSAAHTTAKVFPIGKDNMIQFFDVLEHKRMPYLPRDVSLGPVECAKIS